MSIFSDRLPSLLVCIYLIQEIIIIIPRLPSIPIKCHLTIDKMI